LTRTWRPSGENENVPAASPQRGSDFSQSHLPGSCERAVTSSDAVAQAASSAAMQMMSAAAR